MDDSIDTEAWKKLSFKDNAGGSSQGAGAMVMDSAAPSFSRSSGAQGFDQYNLLAQLAQALARDHRGHDRRGSKNIQRIWWRTNTLPQQRRFQFSARARTCFSHRSTEAGGDLIHAHARVPRRTYGAPTHPTRHAPRSTAPAPAAHARQRDATGSSARRGHTPAQLTKQPTHAYTCALSHAPEAAIGRT